MNTILSACLAALPFSVCLISAEVVAGSSWSENALESPSKHLLLAEARGRVTIYDRLNEEQVDQALDGQFHRIQSMMFTRIRRTAPDGAEAEDHDCD